MSESLKQKTLKGFLWNGLGTFANRGVTFAFGVVLARLLTPDDYGIIGMITVFTVIADCFISSGFYSALVRKADRTEADKSTVFYFNIVVAFLCYAILFVTAPLIAQFYNQPILTDLVRVIGLTLILGSPCTVHWVTLSVRLDFKTPAKIQFYATLTACAASLYCAWLGWGVWSLVVLSLLRTAGASLLALLIVRWRPRVPFSWKSFRELFGYGSKLLASSLLDTAFNNITPLVIGKFFSSATLGLYSRAQHWAALPSVTMTNMLQNVSFPVLSSLQNEGARLREGYRKFLRMSAFIIFPLMVGISALADPLIRLVLTDKWADCVPILQIICFSLMWYPIHAINLSLLQVKGRSDLFLRLEIYKKIIIAVILAITIPQGIYAMCVGSVVSSILCLSINTHYTGKLIDLGYWRQMTDLTPSLIHSLVMGALAYCVQLATPGLVAKVLAGTASGALYYIGINALCRTAAWKETLHILKGS